jgi:hypothetical protein
MILCEATPDGRPLPYRLKAVPAKRGRPKSRESEARAIALWKAYEARKAGNSDLAFEQIANAAGVSVSTVRQAVTSHRKRRNK